MITRGDISDMARSWKEKFTSFSDSNVADYYSDISLDDPKAAANQAPKDPTLGVDAVLKTFYEGKNSSANYYDWTETPPKQLSKRVAKANDRVAIKIYKTKDIDKPIINGKFYLKYHMIEIQSSILVAALKDILQKEDVYLEPTEIANFKYPFRPLWFCYDEIVALHRSNTDGALKPHLQLLLKVMGDVFGSMKIHLKNLQSSGLISFKLAWTYFPKDSIVYSPEKDCEKLCKVVDTEYIKDNNGKAHLIVKAEEICFDGETFAWNEVKLDIKAFEGNRPVIELDHYPLSFNEDAAKIKAKLSARGERVLDYQGLTYCEYSGLGIFNDDCSENEKHNVNGRILVDIYGYNKHHVSLQRRGGKAKKSKRNREQADTTISTLNAHLNLLPPPPPVQFIIDGLTVDANGLPITAVDSKNDSYIKRLTEDEQKKNKDNLLARRDDLVFLSPMLMGYALKNKLWLSFYVDDIKPMVWNDEAYDHLVYPEEQKDLVLSFVDNHKRTKQGIDDVIMGKGQGLILLLSGPPGTGKTLTAEAVADKTRRPLYYLQAEDLGINASLLGANIKKVFEMATEWDAVILLDEADVFMAERNPNDIARNELVSIFLRELEYFRGIIFLTTNLYSTIDTAFRSRVNIHLLFNPLPPASRLVLWRKFLERLPPMKTSPGERPIDSLEEGDLEELAKWELNGREIKNAIKTVKSWCDAKGYEMNLLRLESGIKVTAPQGKKTESGDSGLYD